MNTANKYVVELQSLVSTNSLIEVDRSPMTKHNLRGLVVAANDHFLTLNIVDDSCLLNGYTIIKVEDVKRYRIIEDTGNMIRYVLSQRYPDGYLKKPKIELKEMEDFSFLQTIHEGYPLVTVFREEMDDTACSIGRVEALKPKTFLVQAIGTDATWIGVQRFRYEDVTRIDFGGSYEEALWMYAEHLGRKKKRSK